MRVCFVGDSHAPRHLARAAEKKGFIVADRDPEIYFVSQDAPTKDDGERDLTEIELLTRSTVARAFGRPVIVTSQVTPGWTRALNLSLYPLNLFHQIETLRIIDADRRALHPEMHVIGCKYPEDPLPEVYQEYLSAWDCPKFRVSYEEAEFTKIAINTFLAAQVDTTNRLSKACEKIGADWRRVALCLRWDKRIGQYAYLKPGRWQDSKHLLRDAFTLESL